MTDQGQEGNAQSFYINEYNVVKHIYSLTVIRRESIVIQQLASMLVRRTGHRPIVYGSNTSVVDDEALLVVGFLHHYEVSRIFSLILLF